MLHASATKIENRFENFYITNEFMIIKYARKIV